MKTKKLLFKVGFFLILIFACKMGMAQQVDDIRIFNRSLSENEILELYQKPNPVGIAEYINSADNVDVYPNPANDACTIRISSTDLADEWMLRDVTGRIIAREKFSGTSAALDLSSYSAGLYIITFINQGKPVLNKKLEVVR